MGVKISELRHRIKFQHLTRIPDGQGGWEEQWDDFIPPNQTAPEVWAKITPISSRERMFSQQIQNTLTHRIVIRSFDGLTTEKRILFEGRIFQIHGIARMDEERWFIVIDTEEGVAS